MSEPNFTPTTAQFCAKQGWKRGTWIKGTLGGSLLKILCVCLDDGIIVVRNDEEKCVVIGPDCDLSQYAVYRHPPVAVEMDGLAIVLKDANGGRYCSIIIENNEARSTLAAILESGLAANSPDGERRTPLADSGDFTIGYHEEGRASYEVTKAEYGPVYVEFRSFDRAGKEFGDDFVADVLRHCAALTARKFNEVCIAENRGHAKKSAAAQS